MKVVLPLPFMPTTARRSPERRSRLMLRRAKLRLPAYRKLTLRKVMSNCLSLRFSTARLPWYISFLMLKKAR